MQSFRVISHDIGGSLVAVLEGEFLVISNKKAHDYGWGRLKTPLGLAMFHISWTKFDITSLSKEVSNRTIKRWIAELDNEVKVWAKIRTDGNKANGLFVESIRLPEEVLRHAPPAKKRPRPVLQPG